ncbi:MAG: SDR family oxidoreductase [Dehalococcoidia bacterium]|jgi:NAD(P)-dependent dehydrogenase (short-subunit alcohol dehydrogenase family)
MDLGLTGKIAIVTGGSDGIGRAAATAMAEEGAKVAIVARTQADLDRTTEELKKETGNNDILGIAADVTNEAQVQKMVDTVVGTWGGLDILVNNAGTSSAGKFETVQDETWKNDIGIKVYGAIHCSRAALPHMKQRGGGRIINTTTPGGKAPGAGSLPTSLARAAGISLTKAMSKDYAADNILINTICVGILKSRQHRRRWEAAHEKDPNLTLDAFYDNMGGGVPVGRIGEAREAGDVIAFLASERASYITGASVNVDGGTSPVV